MVLKYLPNFSQFMNSNINLIKSLLSLIVIPTLVIVGLAFSGIDVRAAGTTYYVSTSGSDSNNGTSSATPFATIAKVNTLNLQPGDSVLFKCGDTWEGEMLYAKKSGTSGNPITYSSYPTQNCADQPIISGSKSIAGWTTYSGNIYVTDLDTGSNTGLFPNGINQVFRNDVRLGIGRYPNYDTSTDGYSTITVQPSSNQLTLNSLPAGDWTGASVNVRTSWDVVVTRTVSSNSGNTITADSSITCESGCAANGGWGYWVSNSLLTLDTDGEWWYDSATNQVYLYSSSTPTNIAGSVRLQTDTRAWGGITVGTDLSTPVDYVVINNFKIKNWHRNGISTPTNYSTTDSKYITISNNTIKDSAELGISLKTYIFANTDGLGNNWRGSQFWTVSGNTISGSGWLGIYSESSDSTFSGNTVTDTALYSSMGARGFGAGIGGFSDSTMAGTAIAIDKDGTNAALNNVLEYNVINKSGYSGFDIWGSGHTIRYNQVTNACYSKADCGAIRTFGSTSIASTTTKDITISNNILKDIRGNNKGVTNTKSQNFAFGLYIDNYSANIDASNNTIQNISVSGIRYQNSTGDISGNVVYDNSNNGTSRSQVDFTGSATAVTFNNNVMYAKHNQPNNDVRNLTAPSLTGYASGDNNYYFHPYNANGQIVGVGTVRSLTGWKTYTVSQSNSRDANSKEAWYTFAQGDTDTSQIFTNNTASLVNVSLTGNYKDLDQNPVSGTLTLPAFSSKVLIQDNSATVPVYISEVNPHGSSAAADDYWVELYNPNATAVDLTNHILVNAGTSNANLTLTSGNCSNLSISASSYFLISKYNNSSSSTKLNVTPDCVFSSLDLSGTGKQLFIRDSTNANLDSTPSGNWLGNSTEKVSMSRDVSNSDGSLNSNWFSSVSKGNFKNSSSSKGDRYDWGTPKQANISSNFGTSKVIEGENLYMRAGNSNIADVNAVNGITRQVASGWGAYGPYLRSNDPTGSFLTMPSGQYQVSFRARTALKSGQTDNISDLDQVLMRLEVNEAFKGADSYNNYNLSTNQGATYYLTKRNLSSNYTDYTLNFNHDVNEAGYIEFRAYNSSPVYDLFLDKVTITPNGSQSTTIPVSAFGSLSGLRVFDSVNSQNILQSNNTQGFLQFGPYTNQFSTSSGTKTANFLLSGNQTGTANGVFIDVMRLDRSNGSMTTLNRQFITNAELNSTSPKTFPLTFATTNNANQAIEFRVYTYAGSGTVKSYGVNVQ
ncbi:MAG: hypothetical protein OHK0017_03840 [Patescibacteria group bacterium]